MVHSVYMVEALEVASRKLAPLRQDRSQPHFAAKAICACQACRQRGSRTCRPNRIDVQTASKESRLRAHSGRGPRPLENGRNFPCKRKGRIFCSYDNHRTNFRSIVRVRRGPLWGRKLWLQRTIAENSIPSVVRAEQLTFLLIFENADSTINQ